MSSEKILSAEQTRKLLHISKRKCAYLLEHRIIPCEITEKKTHRYLVREEDVLAYAERADEIILPPVFSSAAGKSHRKKPDPRIGKFAFLRIWAKEPDAFTPADVQRLTGYTGSTVGHGMPCSGSKRENSAQSPCRAEALSQKNGWRSLWRGTGCGSGRRARCIGG